MLKSQLHRYTAPSPIFSFSNSASIGTTSKASFSWESINANTLKYLPFNFVRIVNNSNSDINFYPNQDDTQPYFIPSGSIMSIDKASVPALRSFTIENTSSTDAITTGQIKITSNREI